MDQVKKVLFIINRFAGGGFPKDGEQLIEQACSKHNLQRTIEFTKGPGHATTLAREATKLDNQMVVAVGGDGTLNEVAQGLVHSSVALGIIPRGSGNGLARHLCIPLAFPNAINSLFTNEIRAIDTFTLNGKLSINVSGIGFDGRVANLFGGKTSRGLSGYVKLIMREFFSFAEFPAEVISDKVALKRNAFIMAIANSSQYGNNACIAPGASVSDGVLHLNILKKIPAYRLDILYALFTKKIDQTNVAEVIPIRNFQIKTPAPVPYHVDGEPCGTGCTFDIVVNPASLMVVIPRNSKV